MIKHIVAAVALLAATPVQAQTVSVNVNRFQQLVDIAPTLCRNAWLMGGTVADNIERLLPASVTTSERLFMLSMCKLYLHGILDSKAV